MNSLEKHIENENFKEAEQKRNLIKKSNKMGNLTQTKGSIFLTDYASYNNGTQFEFGHWVDLEKFCDAEELNEYIKNHFEEADKKNPLDEYGTKREEIMITDFEGFPEVLYSESGCDFEKIYGLFEYMDNNGLENLENEEDNLLNLWNEYVSENCRGESQINNFDDENLAMMLGTDPMRIFSAGVGADINWGDDYIFFTGYGLIKSTNDPSTQIDETLIISWIIETKI